MLFSSRLSLASMIELCRSMRFALSSGLMLRDTMDMLAVKGVPGVRHLAARVGKDLRAGWSLHEAFQKQSHVLPPLFLALVAVGEESGNLPEVLTELENYYLVQQKLRRDLLEQLTWPVVQLVAAVLIITGLIYLLGIIARSRGGEPIDPLGLGLVGPRGALIFFSVAVGSALLLALAYWLASYLFRRRAVVERLLLYVPVVGPCVRALALTRFCVAMRLMLETSLSIVKTLRLALLATDNAAFVSCESRVESALRRGRSVSESLAAAGVFTPQFLGVVAVAEESGRLPEALRHQAAEYDDAARRRLARLNQFAGYGVWIGVASLLILAVFRIFTIAYLQNIEKVLPH